MTGEGQLFGSSKDAHTHTLLAFCGNIAPLNKCRLTQIHLACNRLHLFACQSTCIQKNRQRIACKLLCCKNIHQPVIKFPHKLLLAY